MSQADDDIARHLEDQRSVLYAVLRRDFRQLSEQDIEDVIQDVFVSVLKRSPDAKEVGNLKAFVMRAAHNDALDLVRSRTRRKTESLPDMTEVESVDESQQLDRIIASHQELSRIIDIVQEMPMQMNQAFTLRHVAGSSIKEIAEQLGIKERRVEHLLVRALIIFARTLGTAALPQDETP